ncbi:MAG: cation:proton antiporter [Planctomycetes bacterium]|nr:cation:proton antiporter [Planctomycetota bacterium]
MHVDPLLPTLVAVLLTLLAIALVLRVLRQPHVVAYLVAGVALGPQGAGLVEDTEVIQHMGSIGLVLLMFFVGMEVSPRQLIQSWRVAVIGTAIQVVISVASVLGIGALLSWPLPRSIVLGMVISLSSTAVVLKLLKDRGELDTDVGRDVLGVLLVQDLAIIPMLGVIGIMGEPVGETGVWAFQLVGGIGLVLLCVGVARSPVKLPFTGWIRRDHELQVFASGAVATSLALVSGLMGLSTAMGAFVAGMVVAAARETEWVHRSLEPFRVAFVAVFFLSVGMLLDLDFLVEHLGNALFLVAAVLVTNNVINAVVLRVLGSTWKESIYAGALLSQIGEFSFVLASVAFQVRLIEQFGYSMTIAVIALSLALSPAWIALVRGMLGRARPLQATS